MTTANTLKASDLEQFTGTGHWYRHPLVRKVVYTEGARHVAMKGGAYWLLDAIACAQSEPCVAAAGFQVWTLKVNADQSATLTCEDGNDNGVYRQALTYTDFPLPEITLWFSDNTILLPSEW